MQSTILRRFGAAANTLLTSVFPQHHLVSKDEGKVVPVLN